LLPVFVAMAPIRTDGIAMTTHPAAATYDNTWAFCTELADNTLWKYTCWNIQYNTGQGQT